MRKIFGMSRPGYLYVIHAQGYHKIGCTTNLAQRIAMIRKEGFFVQTEKGMVRVSTEDARFVQVYEVENMLETERFLHKHFQSCRASRSEWFQIDHTQLEQIEDLIG